MPGKFITTEEFITRAKKVHGDKYDYSKVDYKNNKTNVIILCSVHGEFIKDPYNHLNGVGCQKCSMNNRTFDLVEHYKQNPKGQELGYYYQIKLFNGIESFFKRGITSENIKKRFLGIKTLYDYEIIDALNMTNLQCAEKEREDKKNINI